jgi:hypothetical protein
VTLSIALRIGRRAVGIQTTRPFFGFESVGQDGAWLIAFHVGAFPK